MAKTRKQKEDVVRKLESALKGATAVFVGFTGVTVSQETKMRRAMREDGLDYMVAKKTLIRRALQGLGHSQGAPMQGEVAIAYTVTSSDTTAPAQRVHAFGKEFGEGKLSILGGIFDGKAVGAELMRQIAIIPSLQVLRGMFANIINSPRQRFAVALSEVAKIKN
ncbi:MAG TPA: 50S ribosomal protein L10 [Candidatus Paceibacterota bacterium]